MTMAAPKYPARRDFRHQPLDRRRLERGYSGCPLPSPPRRVQPHSSPNGQLSDSGIRAQVLSLECPRPPPPLLVLFLRPRILPGLLERLVLLPRPATCSVAGVLLAARGVVEGCSSQRQRLRRPGSLMSKKKWGRRQEESIMHLR